MKTDIKPRGVLRLEPCSYGLSRLTFRGPMRPTDGRFVAFLGGSETFGKYIAKPFPDLIETAIGEVCVNLGCPSSGPDVYLHDTATQSLCHDATATVIQIMGAANITNSFYKVHPRRNDRFIAPTDQLVALYPDVDFSEISFTGHLIERLRSVDEERFKIVRAQLQKTWLLRMKELIKCAGGPVFLLWFANRAPEAAEDGAQFASAPVLVTREMVEDLRACVDDIIEVVGENGQIDEMCFAPLEEIAASEMLGANAHSAAARAMRAPLLHSLY